MLGRPTLDTNLCTISLIKRETHCIGEMVHKLVSKVGQNVVFWEHWIGWWPFLPYRNRISFRWYTLSHFCLLSLLKIGSNNHYRLGTNLEFLPKYFLGSFSVYFPLSTSLHYCCKEQKVQIIGAKNSVFQILMHGLTHVPYFLHMLDHPF